MVVISLVIHLADGTLAVDIYSVSNGSVVSFTFPKRSVLPEARPDECMDSDAWYFLRLGESGYCNTWSK